jgi:hypothetical protein
MNRPTELYMLSESIPWNQFLGSLKGLQIRAQTATFYRWELIPLGSEIKVSFKNEKNRKRLECIVKWTMPQDFWLQAFYIDQFPPIPWLYYYGRFKFFRKFVEIFAAQGAPPVSLTPVANEKNQKNFHHFFGHLWVAELAYRNSRSI